ncbi:amino acid adenylation domain-containing protein [Sphaerothrix gracilis]|uniref:amino acid adenylation domain-containing protein n=1 Tax=Sphaerothrix gracilis TaxID=3151835 RepID=UPI0031FE2C30
MVNHLFQLTTHFSTLIELLRYRATEQSQQRAYTFLVDGETQEESLTYAELDSQARAIAAHLQQLEAIGERAILLYPPGLEFIVAFFGCLYAGVIAVPAYPPRQNRRLSRLQAIMVNAQARLALTSASLLANIQETFGQGNGLERLQWLSTDRLDLSIANRWQEPAIASSDLAFLQYTSGSTGMPKGVMISHQNLLHNSALIQQCFGDTVKSLGVSWLPPYHDMGLIGGILQPLYVGAPTVLMSPVAFLQKPIRWLQAISHYQATTSGGPNFAYDLLCQKVTPEQVAALDLSGWQVAFSGAEPVRAQTLESFAAKFAPAGFRYQAFYPCYGLAENTLIVTGGDKAASPVVRWIDESELAQHKIAVVSAAASLEQRTARAVVGCGHPHLGQQLVIVDPERLTVCAEGTVGEIWVAGDSVAQGYWHHPVQTQAEFQAHLADTQEGPFLRTGDLGFWLEGELFMTGRLKDLIIIRGCNHYPQDIELTVEQSHPALRANCGAAFAVEVEGQERLIVVQEVKRSYLRKLPVADVLDAIRRAVSEQHDLQVYAVFLLKTASLPKTSSGKVQRRACRTLFKQGQLNAIADWSANPQDKTHFKQLASEIDSLFTQVQNGSKPPAQPAEQAESPLVSSPQPLTPTQISIWLRDRVTEQLQLDPGEIRLDQPLINLGLDSLTAITIAAELQERFCGLQPAPEAESPLSAESLVVQLIGGESISSLSAQICQKLPKTRFDASAAAVKQPSPEGSGPEIGSNQKSSYRQYPLCHNQQALWFLNQLTPESAAYNVAYAARLRPDLNIRALQQAFEHLAKRHEILRTTYAQQDGQPIQVVHPDLTIPLQIQVIADGGEAELRQWLTQAAERPLDLSRGPILRANLRVQPGVRDAHAVKAPVLLVTAHHIAVDLRSLELLMAELCQLYAAANAGTLSPALPAPCQYQEHVFWEVQKLAGDEHERLWVYWQQQLAGELPILNLPTDKPRPAVQTYRGACYPFEPAADLMVHLKAVAQAAGTTLYMLLLAAFQVLLYRYTQQTDILVASPVANRHLARFERAVGYFANTVVLRTQLSADLTFSQLLGQVRQTVLGALAHQAYPFSLLVEKLQPTRDPSLLPLAQVSFSWNQLRHADVAGGTQAQTDLLAEPILLGQQGAAFDLMLNFYEAGGTYQGVLNYNSDLFEAATVARLARHFQVLLAAIVANPQQQIAELPLLETDERQQLLAGWRDRATSHADRPCLHQLFEAQVARSPDAIAITFEAQALTYRELNNRANQLAHRLKSLGVEPESLVGLYVDRSPEMIVGILAILKAGGAYVPIDPAYASERLASILADASIKILVTQQSLLDQMPALPVRLACLDTDPAVITQQTCENPVSTVTAANLAYVIYTSGSTGKPKGVLVSHHNVTRLFAATEHWFKFEPTDVWTLFHSYGFDFSVWEIWGALLYGGQLVIVPQAVVHSPSAFYELLHRQQVTVLNQTPSSFRQLIKAEELSRETVAPDSLKLRLVIFGGEALELQSLRPWFERHGDQSPQLVNMYGITETTVHVTYRPLRMADLDSRASVIGCPLPDLQVYILDSARQPVPIGVPGEMYIGGAGVSRGYLNRPEMTAQSFVPNPFGPSNTYLYKSGDLARYLPNRDIEYLGRIDHQVKIRGFRIELGEIEAVLGQHPGIRETVVLARQDSPGDRRLVAYIVPKQPTLTTSELYCFLKGRLPNYMIPAAFVLLEALPLTPNGKVDRRLLPAPSGLRPDLTVPYAAPQTEIEQQIAAVWQQVLQVNQLGIHDNFFELGGNSLLLVQSYNQLKELAQPNLSIVDLFQYPTVETLANYLSQTPTQPFVTTEGAERIERRRNCQAAVRQRREFRQRHRAKP